MSAVTAQRARPPGPVSEGVTLIASFLLAAAGLAHLSVAPVHFVEWWAFGALFLVAATAQLALAVGLLLRPSRNLVTAAAVLSVGLISTWVMSRTGGLPFGPKPAAAEGVGVLDSLTTLVELLLVALILLAVGRPTAGLERRLLTGCEASSVAFGVALTLAFAGGVGHG